MKLFYYIFSIALCMACMTACLKDKGNYNYVPVNQVRITHSNYNINGITGDSIKVTAIRTYSNPNDTSDFDHAWYVDGALYSTERDMTFVGYAPGRYTCRYYMIDRKSGVTIAPLSSFGITLTSAYQTGWGILTEKDGKSELAHVRVTNGIYYNYTNIYKTVNGEELGSQPVKIRDYPVTNGRGMIILQHGGQGSMEVDAYTLKKQILLSQSFIGGKQPANFKPVDAGFFLRADFLVNENGDIYPRYFQNPIPYTVPWMNVTTQVIGGMKITDIWDAYSSFLTYALMYDKLNNRVLYVKLESGISMGGYANVDTLPAFLPGTPVPADYIPLKGMGNWEYVWGGTFLDGWYAAAGCILMKNPADQQIYVQTFNTSISGGNFAWSYKLKMPFLGTQYVTPKSKYVALKAREYLFFSGGPNNDRLYYFDVKTGATVKLYKQFESPITVLTTSDNSNEIAVGLENGTFILHDVSAQAIVAGTAPELHRLSGLGKVVDIVVKGGNVR